MIILISITALISESHSIHIFTNADIPSFLCSAYPLTLSSMVLSICQSVCLSFPLSGYDYVCLNCLYFFSSCVSRQSARLNVCLSASLSVYLSASLSRFQLVCVCGFLSMFSATSVLRHIVWPAISHKLDIIIAQILRETFLYQNVNLAVYRSVCLFVSRSFCVT